jgi:signal peptidase I
MKKYQIILLIVFTVIVATVIIGRTTNALQYYSVPTHSNEPTFKNGSHFLASNLKTPKRMDFICYKSSVPEYYNQVWFHRLVGLPGDTIFIKDNDLYINGINQDLTMNLKKEYIVHRDVILPLNLPDEEVLAQGYNDSLIAVLETITHKDIIKQGRRYTNSTEDERIKTLYGQPWNAYNFGPFVVKPNTYFVLGDNRNRSMDSRYSGPVKMENYLTTILKK